MRWDDVLRAMAVALSGDTTLAGIFGTSIRKAGTQEWAVPSLEWTLISTGGLTELWHPHVVQFDLFTESMADLASAERALWGLFQDENPQFVEGVYMWTTFLDSFDLAGPSREAYYSRGLRFQFQPYRQRMLRG